MGDTNNIDLTLPTLKPPFSPSTVLIPPSKKKKSRVDSLPTIFGKDNHCGLVKKNIAGFLKDDLNLERLNEIDGYLWMAGRPMRARPLHRYKMLGFDVLHTQQMDLHILKYSNQVLVKPLPEYLLSHSFWTDHLCGNTELHKKLHEAACGFLLSYIWLLVYPIDLQLAQEFKLVPKSIKWSQWEKFVTDFVNHIDINALDQVNKRYHFGELRLGRINTIFRVRFAHRYFVRGYLYGYNRYVVFFQRNFSWILVVFVFFSLVLSAMQVGVSVSPLKDDEAYRKATYGFVVFSMMSVAFVLTFVSVLFTLIFIFNMVAAIAHDRQQRKDRGLLAQARAEGHQIT